MNPPQLVIIAAGLGSRFGGLKQITPVDDEGHLIIDFSIYDAIQAGFGEVIFVISPMHEQEFRAAMGDRIAKYVSVKYAYQTLNMLPEGYRAPLERVKPWGTAHAVLCAKSYVHGAFAAINADDFYGRSAYSALYSFLTSKQPQNVHSMVGYRIENTLTEHGYVSRGVCEMNDAHELLGVTERVRIEPMPGGAAYTEDGENYTFIPSGTIVSMNCWGFQRSMMDEIELMFKAFLDNDVEKNPLKAEFYLPSVPNNLIVRTRGEVRVLPTDEKWYGVTYPDDLESVRRAIQYMKAQGVYPQRLWNGERV